MFIRFTASAFRKLPSIYVFSYFPFGFEGRMWDLIVSVPDHCLSFYFCLISLSYNGSAWQFIRLDEIKSLNPGTNSNYEPPTNSYYELFVASVCCLLLYLNKQTVWKYTVMIQSLRTGKSRQTDWSVCHSVCIFWMHYSVINPSCAF